MTPIVVFFSVWCGGMLSIGLAYERYKQTLADITRD